MMVGRQAAELQIEISAGHELGGNGKEGAVFGLDDSGQRPAGLPGGQVAATICTVVCPWVSLVMSPPLRCTMTFNSIGNSPLEVSSRRINRGSRRRPPARLISPPRSSLPAMLFRPRKMGHWRWPPASRAGGISAAFTPLRNWWGEAA